MKPIGTNIVIKTIEEEIKTAVITAIVSPIILVKCLDILSFPIAELFL